MVTRTVLAACLASASTLASAAVRAETLYVAPAPAGSDDNPGTEALPFASMAKAQSAASAGDTVYFRAGTYAYDEGTTTCSSGTATISGVVLEKDGQAGSPIRYFAFPGEVPVFDFDGIRDSCRIRGITVLADYVHLKGLEIKGVRQNNNLNHESWGVWNQGSHNIFEALDVHHIMGAGIFIQRGGDNLVLNCDSHHNLDELTSNGAGESADGFGCHVNAGESGNVFRGCRAWWNADDGYDFINSDAACTVEHSWAWFNGYRPDTMEGIGNGNGFKGGGYGADPADFPADPAEHTTRFCLAFSNRAAGFYANHHPGSLFFHNNTGYGNHPNFNMLGMSAAGADITVGQYRNNVALAGTLFSNRNDADEANNAWTIAGVMPSEADFQSVATSGMDAPRQADGSLPVLPNFRLVEGSDLIDKGVDLGLPFSGAAPDLGAFEVGLAPPSGLGGSGGTTGGQGGQGGQGGLTDAGGSAGSVSRAGTAGAVGVAGTFSGGGSGSGPTGGTGAIGNASGSSGAGAPSSPGELTGARSPVTSSGCACGIARRTAGGSLPGGVAILLLGMSRRRARGPRE